MTRPSAAPWVRRSVLAVVVLGIASCVVAVLLPSPQEREQVRAADRVAARYDRSLDAVATDLQDDVRRAVRGNLTDMGRAFRRVKKLVAAIPKAPTAGTTAYGREHSEDYRTAEARRVLEAEPYADLIRTLAGAAAVQEFIDAAGRALQVNPAELLQGMAVTTGAPLRDEVVPAFRKAKADVRDHPAPPGDKQLERDVVKFLDDAVKQVRRGADDIDAGRPFFFDFGTKPRDLDKRLQKLQRALAGQVLQVLDEVTSPS